MAPACVVVSLLWAGVTAFAPDGNMKMIRTGSAVTPEENVKMMRKSVTITPNGEVASAVEVEKQLADILQDEDTEGVHSDAFNKGHDAIVAELGLKKQYLEDWVTQNIQPKTRERDNKKKELSDYRGESANAWWQKAWKAIKRAWQNLFYDKENRLKGELSNLEKQRDAMIAERKRLENEVLKMTKVKDDSKASAQEILAGLKEQISSVTADIAFHKQKKADAHISHTAIQAQRRKEHGAAEFAKQTVIDDLQNDTYAKRTVFYSLTATCAHYAKKGITICKKCSNDKACGESCIPKLNNCDKEPGCACDDEVGHSLHQEFKTVKKTLNEIIEKQRVLIAAKQDILKTNAKDIGIIDADKKAADAAYTTEKSRLLALKANEEKAQKQAEEKITATQAKLAAEAAESQAAVTKLEAELQKGISDLKSSHAEEKKSKQLLLAAQEAFMRELLEQHALVIGDWKSRILNDETEKARLQKEADELSAAITNAAY